MNEMVSKSFDLEQSILKCWNVTDDLRVVLEEVMENDSMSKDDVANMLLGIITLYDARFDRTFRNFEHLHMDICRANQTIETFTRPVEVQPAEVKPVTKKKPVRKKTK